MKCPTCKKGNMTKKNKVMEDDGIGYEVYRCNKCGEEVLDMYQLRDLAIKYRKWRKAKEITFSKWGNSLAVRIPSEIAEKFKIKEGRKGTLTEDKEGIRIIPST